MKKIIFVHIPKNAGNAILETYSDFNLKLVGHDIRNKSYKVYGKRYRYRLLRFFSIATGITLVKSFAIVRNPWDRVYSAYNFLSKGGLEESDTGDFVKYIAPYADFNDFVKYGLEKASKEQLHFLSQLFWITNEKGKVVVDRILRYESLDSSLKQLTKEFGMPSRELVVANKKNFCDYREFYNEESKQIVAKIYSKTIAMFNYSF